MKQVLSIQDLSCLGKCSLTVALPVLSAMGCACTPLPTALLSSHTAFPNPHVRSLTEDMEKICVHWQSIGVSFDAVTVGYLSDAAQAEAVEKALDRFRAPVILDPAMGDHGKLYSGLDVSHVDTMKRLCRKAAVVLPNATEAALLTGTPYKETTGEDYFRLLLTRLLSLGAKSAVITGVSLEGGSTGYMGITPDGTVFSYQTRCLPSCHGTGDLFTAVFAGMFVKGRSLADCAAPAAAFVEKVLSSTKEPTPFGASFETQLPWLWEQLL